MALTWATGVRFGRATRRNERENELHLAANAYGGLGHRPGQKTLISMSYFMFFSEFFGLLFCSSFWPKFVLGTFLYFGLYLYVAKANVKFIIEF
ncbi:hypothetical protein Hanom_Chr14g01313411 [Helianthus anomalus]